MSRPPWVGPGRLTLDKVVIRPIPEHLVGRFYRLADRVELEEGLDEAKGAPGLRHELCHALSREWQKRVTFTAAGQVWYAWATASP